MCRDLDNTNYVLICFGLLRHTTYILSGYNGVEFNHLFDLPSALIWFQPLFNYRCYYLCFVLLTASFFGHMILLVVLCISCEVFLGGGGLSVCETVNTYTRRPPPRLIYDFLSAEAAGSELLTCFSNTPHKTFNTPRIGPSDTMQNSPLCQILQFIQKASVYYLP